MCTTIRGRGTEGNRPTEEWKSPRYSLCNIPISAEVLEHELREMVHFHLSVCVEHRSHSWRLAQGHHPARFYNGKCRRHDCENYRASHYFLTQARCLPTSYFVESESGFRWKGGYSKVVSHQGGQQLIASSRWTCSSSQEESITVHFVWHNMLT